MSKRAKAPQTRNKCNHPVKLCTSYTEANDAARRATAKRRKEHLSQPVNNHVGSFAKPLQKSMFSPALARRWLYMNFRKNGTE